MRSLYILESLRRARHCSSNVSFSSALYRRCQLAPPPAAPMAGLEGRSRPRLGPRQHPHVRPCRLPECVGPRPGAGPCAGRRWWRPAAGGPAAPAASPPPAPGRGGGPGPASPPVGAREEGGRARAWLPPSPPPPAPGAHLHRGLQALHARLQQRLLLLQLPEQLLAGPQLHGAPELQRVLALHPAVVFRLHEAVLQPVDLRRVGGCCQGRPGAGPCPTPPPALGTSSSSPRCPVRAASRSSLWRARRRAKS